MITTFLFDSEAPSISTIKPLNQIQNPPNTHLAHLMISNLAMKIPEPVTNVVP